jgi:hypothetical protein
MLIQVKLLQGGSVAVRTNLRTCFAKYFSNLFLQDKKDLLIKNRKTKQ